MDVIVVTWDTLAVGAVGCFGNEWIETPTFDRLAAEGIALDRCVAPSVQTALAWRSVAEPFEIIVEAAASRWFDRATTVVEGRTGREVAPADFPVARLMQAGVDRVREPAGAAPLRLWLHGGGVDVPCEPPEGFATLYVDECDERGIPAPDLESPDWPLHPAVYAGAVSLLDHWLGTLVAELEARAAERPVLLIVAALQGAAWRTTAKRAGHADLQRMQVPAVVCPLGAVPGWSDFVGERIRRPVSLAGLAGTIAEACGDAAAPTWRNLLGDPYGDAEVAFQTAAGSRGLWSPTWIALQPNGEPAPALQLFVQPDDSHCVNDVAGEYRDAADRLAARLQELTSAGG